MLAAKGESDARLAEECADLAYHVLGLRRTQAEHLAGKGARYTRSHPPVRLLGPAECPVFRLKNFYRFHFQVQSDSSAHLHDVIRKHEITYEEYDVLKAWVIQVGLDGEWPLFLDVLEAEGSMGFTKADIREASRARVPRRLRRRSSRA